MVKGSFIRGWHAGQERFSKSANTDRLAELEGLRDFLATAIAKVDEQAKSMAAPAERLRQLLSAPDKRATLLQMAGMLCRIKLSCRLPYQNCKVKASTFF